MADLRERLDRDGTLSMADLRGKAVVPASYLPWGKQADFPGGRPARSIDAVFSRSHTTSWRYQGGKYHDQRSFAAAGQQFVPDSVLWLPRLLGYQG